MNMSLSAVPRYIMRDSILGPRVASQEAAAREFRDSDRTSAAEFVAYLGETHGLHVEMGTFGHEGLPIYAAAMPHEQFKDLAVRQNGPEPRERGLPSRLSYDAVCRLPGYSDGHFSWRQAVEQAAANYFVAACV